MIVIYEGVTGTQLESAYDSDLNGCNYCNFGRFVGIYKWMIPKESADCLIYIMLAN